MAKPLRLGIAGLGFGAAVHLPVLQSLPDVAVVAVAARRIAKAREVAARFAVPRACAGVEALLDEGLDAVSLALPPAETERAAALALDRGLAVLAEKPLATSAAAARRLATQAAGRTATIDLQFAEAPAFAALRRAVVESEAGAVRGGAIEWLHDSHAHRAGSWGWKLDAAAHGGVLAMLGAHLLFLVETALGPIAALQAAVHRGATARLAPPGASAAEDLVVMTAILASGAPLAITLGNAAPGLSRHRWTVLGERGSLVLENAGHRTTSGFTLTLYDRTGAPRVLLREASEGAGGDDRQQGFRRLAERFVAAARTGAPCAPDFAAGARVQTLIEAALAAAASGERVAV